MLFLSNSYINESFLSFNFVLRSWEVALSQQDVMMGPAS